MNNIHNDFKTKRQRNHDYINSISLHRSSLYLDLLTLAAGWWDQYQHRFQKCHRRKNRLWLLFRLCLTSWIGLQSFLVQSLRHLTFGEWKEVVQQLRSSREERQTSQKLSVPNTAVLGSLWKIESVQIGNSFHVEGRILSLNWKTLSKISFLHGENKQRLLEILVFVFSGSCVSLCVFLVLSVLLHIVET